MSLHILMAVVAYTMQVNEPAVLFTSLSGITESESVIYGDIFSWERCVDGESVGSLSS